MRLSALILFTLLFASIQCVHAQRSKVTKSPHHYSNPKVRGNKAKVICPVFSNNRYPFHSIGIKIGDPFALTYKLYMRKHLSIAVDVGKAASGLYNRYFQEKFNEYVLNDSLASAESSPSYVAHKVRADFTGEVKVLYQVDASRVAEGLQLYAGAGWEFKTTDLYYDFEYRVNTGADPFGSFERRRIAMGPQLVAGMEYSYFTIPLAAFMEVEYFTDIQADPGWRRFEGGVGIRYVF